MNKGSFSLDDSNLGWIKGWAVIRNNPWDLAGVYLTKELADAELEVRGAEYVVRYGSRQLGSNNFTID
jgi:hypothetical protein